MHISHHWKGKERKSIYIAPLYSVQSQSAQTWITQFYLQITPCLPFLRKHSLDGASTECGGEHLIAAHYSFIDPDRMKGWVGPISESNRNAWEETVEKNISAVWYVCWRHATQYLTRQMSLLLLQLQNADDDAASLAGVLQASIYHC